MVVYAPQPQVRFGQIVFFLENPSIHGKSTSWSLFAIPIYLLQGQLCTKRELRSKLDQGGGAFGDSSVHFLFALPLGGTLTDHSNISAISLFLIIFPFFTALIENNLQGVYADKTMGTNHATQQNKQGKNICDF